jgi:hypothetical protein
VAIEDRPLNLVGSPEEGQWREWVDDCVPPVALNDHSLRPRDSGRLCSVGRICPSAVGSGIADPETTRSLSVETPCQSSYRYCY